MTVTQWKRRELWSGSVGDELVDIAEGDPELGVEEEVDAAEGGRGDADDGVGVSGEGDGFAEDVGVGGEAVLPEAIAEDDDGGLFFGAEEAAAEGHGELGDVEEVGGGGLSPDALGLAGAADGGGDEVVVAGHVGEGAGLVAEIVVEGQEKLLQQRSPRSVVWRLMSVAGSPTGAGLRTNLLIMEKMVALAPMPRPMEITDGEDEGG